jgi:alpha-beta hydrolase superfamily lysophospholipase
MVFDYRGYGLSAGTPYPCGVAEDGLKFLQIAYAQFLSGHYKNFIIYAQSLGGAIALKAIEEFDYKKDIKLLVLDSSFRDPQSLAQLKINWPISRLISAECTADKNLAQFTMPVLIIHSTLDPVVPYKSGQQLYDKIPSLKKTMWTLDQYGHGNVFFIDQGKYRKEFFNLIR